MGCTPQAALAILQELNAPPTILATAASDGIYSDADHNAAAIAGRTLGGGAAEEKKPDESMKPPTVVHAGKGEEAQKC